MTVSGVERRLASAAAPDGAGWAAAEDASSNMAPASGQPSRDLDMSDTPYAPHLVTDRVRGPSNRVGGHTPTPTVPRGLTRRAPLPERAICVPSARRPRAP